MNLSLTPYYNYMYKPALLAGTLMAMLSVIFGAFGAHALKQIFSAELLQSFETGVRYQFYHAFALLFVSLLPSYVETKTLRGIYFCFLLGILLFSGSIYALCFLKSTVNIGLGGLGILTPVGGLIFIAGWFLLLKAGLNYKQNA